MPKELNDALPSAIKESVLQIHCKSIKKYRCWIKCCFFVTFMCFLGMIVYPFGILFGLIIPDKHGTEMEIVYCLLLVLVEIVIIFLYFKSHDKAHHLEHRTIIRFVDGLKRWLGNSSLDRDITLIYPEQIVNEHMIDHGKPLHIYLYLPRNGKSIEDESREEFGNMVICPSICDIDHKDQTNVIVQDLKSPLL